MSPDYVAKANEEWQIQSSRRRNAIAQAEGRCRRTEAATANW